MKKVLVISFNCFDSSSSNGRALGSLLASSDDLNVAQIYIKKGTPNFLDGEYCFINENGLLKNFFSLKKCTNFFKYSNGDSKNTQHADFENGIDESKRITKTPFKMLCRNIMWRLASFNLKEVYHWALRLKPDFVLVQAGDLPFLLNLGVTIAKKCKTNIVFYTSENYPFKKQNYTNLAKKSLLYPFLRKKLFKSTKRVVECASSLIFLTESLEEEFKDNYVIKGKTYVIYPCSNIAELPPNKRKGQYIFSYCGNLGLGRDETLIEIAKVLKGKYHNCKLIICGRGSETSVEKFKSIDNIQYIGVIPYDDVLKIYEKSNYILHVESFNKLISIDSKHAFSGKIADVISSGRPFIFVGPENMFEYQFLKKTGGALSFNSIESFKKAVSSGLLDKHHFDIINQRLIKEEYFSREKTKEIIFEVFGQ